MERGMGMGWMADGKRTLEHDLLTLIWIRDHYIVASHSSSSIKTLWEIVEPVDVGNPDVLMLHDESRAFFSSIPVPSSCQRGSDLTPLSPYKPYEQHK